MSVHTANSEHAVRGVVKTGSVTPLCPAAWLNEGLYFRRCIMRVEKSKKPKITWVKYKQGGKYF